MKFQTLGSLPRTLTLIAFSASALYGCSNSNDNNLSDTVAPLIDVQVSSAEGGTFVVPDGRLRVTIPAGALSEDASLAVTAINPTTLPSGNLASAGDAFNIDLSASLNAAMQIDMLIDLPPTHPTLAELSVFENDVWNSTNANFFRKSDNTLIGLVNSGGVYQAAYRTLQTESGDAVTRGEDIFLNETFDNENFFGGVVGLHELLNDLTPAQAVSVGAHIDVTKVPQEIVDVLLSDDFTAKQVALDSPEITRALLRADAVVGVKATFGEDGLSELATSAGITCAVCHARVDSTDFELSEGVLTPLFIGPLNLDGVPNRQIDVGTILSLTPFAVNAGQETVDFLQAFGPGRFDARALPDNPLEDGLLNPTSIPPLWNFIDLEEQGYGLNWDGQFASTEDPNNALASRAELVYDLVMHANGAFGTESSGVPAQLSFLPAQALLDAFVAAEDQTPGNDIDQQSLLDIQAWQRSITSPAPVEFDEALAEAGFKLFNDATHAQCANCHITPDFTGPERSADIVLQPPLGVLADGVKTPGLRGVSHIAPYFHDDSAETLLDVMDTYSGRIVEQLSEAEKQALVEYLKSL